VELITNFRKEVNHKALSQDKIAERNIQMENTVKEKEPGFTQERLDAANSGTLHASDLNSTEREQIREYAKTGKIENQEVEVTELVDTPTEPVKPVDSTEKALKEKLFKSQVQANKNKQLLEQQTARADFVNKQLEELKNNKNITERTEDNFDDETQANNVERITRLEEMLRTSLEREQNTVNQQQIDTNTAHQSLEDERSSLAIEKLQNAFPDLKTSVPISQLDGELTSFMDQVGGIDNVNKYLDDPEFKKQKDAEGVTLSDTFIKNKDTFSKVVELNHEFSLKKDENGLSHKDRNSDSTIESFYMRKQYDSGIYSEQLRNAKLTGANAVIDKVVSQKHIAPTMSPSSGADLPTDGMTPTQALEIQRRIGPKIQRGDKLSVEDQTSLDRSREFIRSQYG